MKNLFFLLAVFLLVCSGCKEDDPITNPLISTVWSEIEDSGVRVELKFTSDKDCKYIISQDGASITNEYLYEYESQIVTMYAKKEGNATLKGTISGDKMNIYNTSTNKTIATLTKEK